MTPDFEDQLDQIRVGSYERIKTLPTPEAVDALNRKGKEIAETHGIAVAKVASARMSQRAPEQAA